MLSSILKECCCTVFILCQIIELRDSHPASFSSIKRNLTPNQPKILKEIYPTSLQKTTVDRRRRAHGRLGRDFYEKRGGCLHGHGRLFITLKVSICVTISNLPR